uniref:Uncharacterized protein n=1 Tax=Romanomermis culicivorax TaxID=13658 RepID=A0A915HVR1_ROMCU
MGKGVWNCQYAMMRKWSHTEYQVEYGRLQHRQDNWFLNIPALFKMREVDNLKGNQFARYISFALRNGQTYSINTTSLMEKEWTWGLTNMISDFVRTMISLPKEVFYWKS